jgi:hypothetical protein
MADPTDCPICGSRLAAGAACPQCLRDVGLASGAAEEPLPASGRRSRLAVGAALAAAAGVVTYTIAFALGRPLDGSESALWHWIVCAALPDLAAVALVGGSIAGIVAWVRILNSEGRLRGVAWAAVGALLPVAALCAGAPLSLFTSDPGASLSPAGPAPPTYFVAEAEGGVAASVSAEERRRIDHLWDRLRRLPPQPTLDDVAALYAAPDLEALKAMDAPARTAQARAGTLGMPLLPRSALSIPDLELYSLTRVRFETAPPEKPTAPGAAAGDGGPCLAATATVSDGRRVIRFRLSRRRDGSGAVSDWYFARGKVDFE